MQGAGGQREEPKTKQRENSALSLLQLLVSRRLCGDQHRDVDTLRNLQVLLNKCYVDLSVIT